jgi:hypothetical protein
MIIIETFEAGCVPRHRPTASAISIRVDVDADYLDHPTMLLGCCWSMSGNDDTRPQSLSEPCNRPRKASDPAFSTLVWLAIAPTPLIRCVGVRCTGPLLHGQCQPIPRRAR